MNHLLPKPTQATAAGSSACLGQVLFCSTISSGWPAPRRQSSAPFFSNSSSQGGSSAMAAGCFLCFEATRSCPASLGLREKCLILMFSVELAGILPDLLTTCPFDRGLRCTHVRIAKAGANPAKRAFIFPVSHWNDMNIVIVESPAKAKTINKYLGASYEVLASFGHVRDLPAKNGSVDPNANFQMIWEVDPKAAGRLNDIAKALKGADRLILATDPDREGEAISWHVLEVMKEKRALKDHKIERVVFNAITKQAVTDAMKAPRQIDGALVDAYMARRALDYLVGFTLSPVLWRKLPGARSAGRVQSVALRLVCDRELEIEKFVPREYWSLVATLTTPRGDAFEARLIGADGRKIARLDIGTGSEAETFKQALATAAFAVTSVKAKPAKRHPPPPFTTSTLQQEASRKLGLAPAQTMRLAQRLYEGVDIGGETVGLITYMRTDGIDMAPEAVHAARRVIGKEYGDRYVPTAPRRYSAKAKNAQEAHEAIRPTDMGRLPKMVAKYLEPEQA